jgi:hypothetical protein
MMSFDASRRWSRMVARPLPALLVAATLLACGDDSSSPRSEFGTYALVRVNGQALPFSITTTEGNMVVQGATLTLAPAPSGSPSYSASVAGTEDGVQGILLVDVGRYGSSGGTLTFTSSAVPGLVYPGTRASNSVTVNVPGAAIGATGTITMRFEK